MKRMKRHPIETDRNVFGSLEANKAEIAELEKLIELAEKVTPAKDSKLRKLTGPSGILSQAIAGYFGNAKIIIFTRYKDTLDYLEREIPKTTAGVEIRYQDNNGLW